MNKLVFGVMVSAICLSSACMMEMATAEDIAEGELEAEANVSALSSNQPKPTDYPAAVWLKKIEGVGGMCSGSVIAPDAIMTSAHCVTGVPVEGANRRVWAEAMINGQRKCITSMNADVGVCDVNNNSHSAAVWIQYRPTYQGDLDTMSDAAIIGLRWTNYVDRHFRGYSPADCAFWNREGQLKPSCYFRIYTGTFAVTRNMNMFGFGTPAAELGTLNTGHTYVDWYGEYHFLRDTSTADQQRMCRGDSGGPAAGDKNGIDTFYEMLLGTFSNGGFGDTDCARAGSRERWNRASGQVSFTETALSRSRGIPGYACRRFTSAGGHAFVQCW